MMRLNRWRSFTPDWADNAAQAEPFRIEVFPLAFDELYRWQEELSRLLDQRAETIASAADIESVCVAVGDLFARAMRGPLPPFEYERPDGQLVAVADIAALVRLAVMEPGGHLLSQLMLAIRSTQRLGSPEKKLFAQPAGGAGTTSPANGATDSTPGFGAGGGPTSPRAETTGAA